MKKIIGIACFALFALAGNAQDLKGTWSLDETARQALTSTKSMAVAAQSSSKLASETPVTMVFENGSFRFTYVDGSTLEGGYFVSDGILSVGTAANSAEYKLVEQAGKLSIELASKQQSSFNKIVE
jgi:formate dehydrogenase assembly factor FdhD